MLSSNHGRNPLPVHTIFIHLFAFGGPRQGVWLRPPFVYSHEGYYVPVYVL